MPEPHDKSQSQSQTQTKSSTKPPLPDPALKWGMTPKHTTGNGTTTTDKNLDQTEAYGTAAVETPPDWDNYYDEATKAKLRAKGINPALKAEMEHGRKQGGREGRFWGKVAATSFGGGVIK